jgi:hypothetical protein
VARDQGAIATAPPQAAAPTPTSATAPVVNVSPVGGPSGTVFEFSGFSFPPGALVTYVVTPAVFRANGGSFRAQEGDSFLFRLDTAGYPPGRYAVAFSASGQYADTAYANVNAQPTMTVRPAPTPTAGPSASGAAQFKAEAGAEIDTVYPSLRDIITGCPGSDAITCRQKYRIGGDAYGQMMASFYSPVVPAPCRDLYGRVLQALAQGNTVLRGSGVTANITASEAVPRAQKAKEWLDYAKYLLANEPGACR